MPDSPNNGKQKRAYRKTSETQKIIFDKAMALMSEKGFQGTTIRDICAEAGIPIGTFYNCYKSKIDILKSIYESGDKYMQEAAAGLEGKSALEQLHLFARYYAQLNVNTGVEVMRVLFYPSNEWFAHQRPMQKLLYDIIASGQRSGELRQDIATEEIVNYFFDILRGVCYNWCIYGASFDIVKRMESHISLLCGALTA
ncbi:MAG: TetR/AcrR family transcriptional regulator [Oscillospiraceae bacterium]